MSASASALYTHLSDAARVQKLQACEHNGFPVVHEGVVVGLVLRHQLITLLRKRAFVSADRHAHARRPPVPLALRDFAETYPRHPHISRVAAGLRPDDLRKLLPLSMCIACLSLCGVLCVCVCISRPWAALDSSRHEPEPHSGAADSAAASRLPPLSDHVAAPPHCRYVCAHPLPLPRSHVTCVCESQWIGKTDFRASSHARTSSRCRPSRPRRGPACRSGELVCGLCNKYIILYRKKRTGDCMRASADTERAPRAVREWRGGCAARAADRPAWRAAAPCWARGERR